MAAHYYIISEMDFEGISPGRQGQVVGGGYIL